MLADYIGNADVFPILAKWDYFNHAGVSPWPRRTLEVLREHVEQFGIDCFMSREWFKEVEGLRPLLVRLINADGIDEIALMRNTADGICAISTGIDWRAGDRIVIPAVEYPSNVYPWMDVTQRHGVELIQVAERTEPDGTVRVAEEDLIAAADHPRTRLVAVSHVEWTSGQRLNLATLGAFCRPRRIWLAVDAIQSLGVVPMDVRAMNVDFVFSGGHKWLMGPPGGGFLYCRRELIERIRPSIVGAMSVERPFDWETRFVRAADAKRFEIGTQAFASLLGLKTSIELLLEIGIDAIHAQVRSLGDRFAAGARAKGYTVVSPRADGVTSGSVCFTSRSHKPGTIVHDLRDKHRIELAARVGRLRFAPHFYNTSEQVDRLVAALPGDSVSEG